MYPLPEDFDASYLSGRCVEGVCFAEFQINLHFSGAVILQIEGRHEFEHAAGASEIHDRFPIEQSHLPSIIGDVVTALEFDRPSGDMKISFARGAKLCLWGDCGPYESYRLTSKDGNIVV